MCMLVRVYTHTPIYNLHWDIVYVLVLSYSFILTTWQSPVEETHAFFLSFNQALLFPLSWLMLLLIAAQYLR